MTEEGANRAVLLPAATGDLNCSGMDDHPAVSPGPTDEIDAFDHRPLWKLAERLEYRTSDAETLIAIRVGGAT